MNEEALVRTEAVVMVLVLETIGSEVGGNNVKVQVSVLSVRVASRAMNVRHGGSAMKSHVYIPNESFRLHHLVLDHFLRLVCGVL